jgi:hypothetical protein
LSFTQNAEREITVVTNRRKGITSLALTPIHPNGNFDNIDDLALQIVNQLDEKYPGKIKHIILG